MLGGTRITNQNHHWVGREMSASPIQSYTVLRSYLLLHTRTRVGIPRAVPYGIRYAVPTGRSLRATPTAYGYGYRV